MKTTRELIHEIAANMSDSPKSLRLIRDVLADGCALQMLGITDADKEVVEDAYYSVRILIKSGFNNLEEVPGDIL